MNFVLSSDTAAPRRGLDDAHTYAVLLNNYRKTLNRFGVTRRWIELLILKRYILKLIASHIVWDKFIFQYSTALELENHSEY